MDELEHAHLLERAFETLDYPLYVIDANDYTVKVANPAACAYLEAFSRVATLYDPRLGQDTPQNGKALAAPKNHNALFLTNSDQTGIDQQRRKTYDKVDIFDLNTKWRGNLARRSRSNSKSPVRENLHLRGELSDSCVRYEPDSDGRKLE